MSSPVSVGSGLPAKADAAPPAQDPSLTPLSKALTYLLRHHAHKEGVPISSDGWVSVDDAVQWVSAKRKLACDEARVRAVVAQSDKQRFALRETPDGLAVRANQGHSMQGITVQMRSLPDEVTHAVHGTYRAAWTTIRTAGLSRMRRQHVHLARGLPGESGVISGMRASCELLVWVDVSRARAAGMRFYESDNGVILTDGFDGTVAPEFFSRVEERATGALIWPTRAEAAGGASGALDVSNDAYASAVAASAEAEPEGGEKRQRL